MTNVLLVGESWVSISTHYKGFNHFVSGVYETGLEWFNKAMKEHKIDLTHMAANQFPFNPQELDQYEAIILSDIGLYWCPRNFAECDGYGKVLSNIVKWVKGS